MVNSDEDFFICLLLCGKANDIQAGSKAATCDANLPIAI